MDQHGLGMINNGRPGGECRFNIGILASDGEVDAAWPGTERRTSRNGYYDEADALGPRRTGHEEADALCREGRGRRYRTRYDEADVPGERQ